MFFNLFTPFSGNLVRLQREIQRIEIHPQLEVYATRVHWRVVLLSFGKYELSGSWTRSQFTKVGLASQLCDVCISVLQCNAGWRQPDLNMFHTYVRHLELTIIIFQTARTQM